ncbi:glycoside hydrolase family 28 protein [Maribacter confluentis]|uniref:Glycoside hydrolase family 28 protein n=1 Tax=Maribacter confluentis TaxID=1656093 RepID=A0ABT8RR19_9FLAO|nr:glycoside hydrolase family 28 protein [Maribacter confluentis]MDO1513324.1 glycoside hydrolase family 28 protein [Maribacter confluentis]
MKHPIFFLLTFLTIVNISCKKEKYTLLNEKIQVDAPFKMPPIIIPDFKLAPTFIITDFGAITDDKEKNSIAIEKAIHEANKIGGGTVIIPEGEWVTKKIHFKSNVNLHLKKGAILLFSENPEDYLPAVHTTWEGMECYNYSPLIYAYKCKNIAITGEGKLKAKMEIWKKWFARPKPHMESLKRLYTMASYNKPVEERQMVNDSAHFRPQFIQFNRSEHILLEGVSIENSPFWTIHPYLSKDVVIRNVNVFAKGHNNDGVDPEMSQNILIENCVFDQGDDAIAVKSGRNQDAWKLNTPSKNIVMRNCTMINGHQLLAIGSELSGGIENVWVENCTVEANAKMFHLVFIKTNERRGGYVKNIYVENITSKTIEKGVLGIETDVLYQWRDLVPTIERKLTPIENIYLTKITTSKARYLSKIIGQTELPIKNVNLDNVVVDSILEQKHIHENVLNFKELSK